MDERVPKQTKSFLELCHDNNLTMEEVTDTLQSYVNSGNIIDSATVISLIDKLNYSSKEKFKLLEIAKVGANKEREKGLEKGAKQFDLVAEHLSK